MEVLLTKTASKDGGAGLFPVGYTISGQLVDENGESITPLQITTAGIFLKLPTHSTAFAERPYQFATDKVVIVKPLEKTKYIAETYSSIWKIEPI